MVRMIVAPQCQPRLAEDIRTGLKNLSAMFADMTYDFVDLAKSEGSSESRKTVTNSFTCGSDRLLEAINLMMYVMEKTGRRYNNGIILSRDSRSTASYTKSMSIRQYVNELCEVEDYRNVFTAQIDRMVRFFDKNPDYGGIRKIKVDYNLVEVSDFSILKNM